MDNGESKREETGPIDRDCFKEILCFIEKTDLEFVEFERDGKKFSFRRSGSAIRVLKPAQEAAPAPAEPEAPKLFAICSPIVGRFYSSMGADRPALVVEGGRVTAGQKVAIVEAMKIKKEVFSAVTGRVVRILARNGDAVEYGQELFSVEPESGESQE